SGSGWSGNGEPAQRMASRLETGSVSASDVLVALGNPNCPCGGVKQSGPGAQRAEAGLKAGSHEKAVLRDWLGRKTELHWFPYEGKMEPLSTLLRLYFGPRRRWLSLVWTYSALRRR